jgi:hypothetical protein
LDSRDELGVPIGGERSLLLKQFPRNWCGIPPESKSSKIIRQCTHLCGIVVIE